MTLFRDVRVMRDVVPVFDPKNAARLLLRKTREQITVASPLATNRELGTGNLLPVRIMLDRYQGRI